MIFQFIREFGINVRAATRPDHECRWWKEHPCPAHDLPVWVHPVQAQLDAWDADPRLFPDPGPN
jgi:hypothetical protein